MAPLAMAAPQDGMLRMEVITAYNLVVDSNVESPSTNGPSAAHLGVRLYNDGDVDLTDVTVKIGDLTNAATGAGTQGVFPARVNPQGYTGTFALQMPGGVADAVRVIPRIPAHSYVAQYFFVTYPLKDDLGQSVAGAASVTADDLWLEYDLWASANDGGTTHRVDQTTQVTMRNEISAMANKIWPNTDGKVPNDYLDAIQAQLGWRPDTATSRVPGAVVMEGIWYDLGNVGAGFDNNGDGVPDRNAWMQPAGDPVKFSPLAARLVKCYGLVIIKLNDGTEQLIPFEDRLYFENIPGNNNGVVGLVYYEFIPLDTTKPSQLSPYQEVASGYDNEKFNGDYGASVGSVAGTPPNVTFDKAGPTTVAGGNTATYILSASNNEAVGSNKNFGWPELALPLVIQDSVPAGLVYVAGSATSANAPPAGQSFSVSWSTDGGTTWLASEPAASSVTAIRWTLSGTMAPGETATVQFQASVPTTYAGAIVSNTACLKKGPDEDFACDTTTTLVEGINSLGDFVWRDLDRDGVQDGGTETGIANIGVSLYYDANGDGLLDAGDPLYGATTTNAGGSYGFANLPDGKFIAVVDQDDSDLPTGFSLPNSATPAIAVNLDPTHVSSSAVSVVTADWGFIPALALVKSVTPTTYGAGDLVTFTLDLTNNAAPVPVVTNPVQTAYVTTVTSTRTVQNPANAQGAPNNTFARIDFAQNADTLTSSGGVTYANATGTITKVELLFGSYLTQALVDDTLDVSVNGALFTNLSTAQLNTLQGSATQTYAIDITSKNATWTWALAQALTGELKAKKSSNADGGTIWVDAIGFRVTTTVTPPSPGAYGPSTIDPLPLTDTFDNTKLQYVSASEMPTSVSGGTITWANVGPLNAGVRKTLSVTFRALTPPDSNGNGEPDATTTINNASATNAYFVSGRRTNDTNSSATVTIQPRGSIGDRIWWDKNSNGVQDGGEPGLQNVLVTLSNGAQTRTDANGNYLFSGLVNGTYTVTVSTATLPWTTFTRTYDPDSNTPASARDDISTVIINTTDGLATNDAYTNQDFGYTATLNVINGMVFQDNNGNGTQEAGENFLSGVTVTLTGTSGATTTTDANGFYNFGSLADGTYTVTVTQPGSTTQTLDPDATVNNATTIAASGGNLYPNNNFAYQPSGLLALGDTLYFDWNGNGTQDSGEQGIAGVDMWLYEDANGNGVIDVATDALIATSVTNASGVYGFSNLVAANYLVVVNTADAQFPASVVQTQDYDGVRDDKAVVNLAASLATVDFGYQPVGSGSLGNLVWLDANNNGIKDAAEAGINGVVVQLYRATQTPGVDTPYATTTTAGGGLYQFSGLPAGDWKIHLPASNFAGAGALVGSPLSSTTTVTTDNAVDNDDNGSQSASGSPVTSPVITLTAGEIDPTKDFGFVGVGAVGDFVFFDANANGQQDYSESGIPNVTVNLFLDANADGVADTPASPVATTVTSSGGANPVGFYRFDNVTPGTYLVQVDATTLPQAGGNPIPQTADPDLDGIPVNPPTYVGDHADALVIVTSGSNYSGADFGYQPPGAIGDFVWLDLNQDGVQDPGEPGIAGVTVSITNGTTTYNVTTDFDGYWSQVLADGSWTVSIPESNFSMGAPLEYRATTYDADGTATPNSVALTLSGGAVNLAAGNLGIDFGYMLNGSYTLSGTVAIHDSGVIGVADDVDDFYDDGVDMDAGPNDETELGGREVLLYTGSGTYLGSTYTDANGDYAFSGLALGSYKVVISTTAAPLDYSVLTTTTANNIAGSTVTGTATSVIQQLSLATGDVTHVDFMFNSTVDYDFGDLPADYGMTTLAQDGARHIIPAGGSTVYLGTAPDADVNGMSSALANGDDLTGTDDEDGVAAVSPVSWADGANGGQIEVNVQGGGWLVGWIDFNHDGTFLDSGEMVVSQAVSTGTSTLDFDIPAGTVVAGSQSWLARFRVFTTEPAYSLFSYTGVATDGEVEDYLFEKPVGGSIGDLVWNDADGDGTQDIGEDGIGGRVVELRNGSNVVVATQTTGTGTNDVDGDGVIDPQGYYRFHLLAAGTYTVTVTNPPVGFTPSYDENGTATANVTSVVLGADIQHLTADFGYAPLLADIAGQVRYDVDGDGNPADSDSGAMGVKIQLWSDPNNDGDPADGVQVGEIFTDVSGNYLFTNVASGSYVVVEINPADATSTYDVVGANDDRIAVTMIGTNITGRDFLDTQPPVYAISGTVYDDNNATNDNVIDAGDTPLASVTVKLFWDRDGNGLVSAGDTELGSTVTNSSGGYSFTGLTAGNYVVQEIDPAGATSEWDAAGSLTDNQIGVVLADVNITNRDFLDDGYLGAISGSVAADTNNDTTGDTPLTGVTVTLFTDPNGDGDPADGAAYGLPVTTAADGSYQFTNVLPGSYVVVETDLAGYASVADDDSTSDLGTSPADAANASQSDNLLAVNLQAGETDSGNDFVDEQYGAISGSVAADTNNDNTGDTPLSGVTVTLFTDPNNDGDPADGAAYGAPATTAADGSYQFTNVLPGSYVVVETDLSGYASVTDDDSASDLGTSPADAANASPTDNLLAVNLKAGETDSGNDFVDEQYGTISGSVAADTNNDNTGDTPLPGVTVTLFSDPNGDGDPADGAAYGAPATTAADGSYQFTNVLPGSYVVVETDLAGYASVADDDSTSDLGTSPADAANASQSDNLLAVNLRAGETDSGNDFVDEQLGSISGYVYVGTTPLAGVTLTLLDSNGDPVDGDPDTSGVQPVTTVTASDGFYSFPNVRPGTYQIGQSQPYGYNSVADVDGGNLDIIGDITPVVVMPGQANDDNNFIESVDTCPDDWAEWKYQHPGQTADGNPDGDAYDNLAEFAFAMPYDSGAGNAWLIQPSALNPDILEGVFVRPKGAPDNVVYTLQYAATLDNPIVWQTLVITPEMITTVDNGDCTETVTIHNLESVTGLTAGQGIVRIKAELDEVPPSGIDHTSYTEVEGWKETALNLCCRTYNNPFLRETAFTGTVDLSGGVSDQTLHFTTSAGNVDLATLLAPGVAYYLEVTSGDNEGQRFDVVSASGSTVTLATASTLCLGTPPFNTLIGALPANLAGDTVVIRRHWTLGVMFPPSGFDASNDPELADQVQTFAAGAYTTYWLDNSVGPAHWVKFGDANDQAATVLAPGRGMFVNKRTTTSAMLAYGEVRTNDFIDPLCAGWNLVGGGYPLDQSASGAASRQMTMAANFFGSRDFKTADSFYIWKADAAPSASGYDSYYLLNRDTVQPAQIKWVKVGDAKLSSWDTSKLLLGDGSAFIRIKDDLHGYSIPSPWAP